MGATRVGTSTHVIAGSYFLTGGQGASLASASSITITDSFHQVTGAVTINTIVGGQANMGLFLFRAAGATWTFGSSGNIKASGNGVAERVEILVTPDGTTWYGLSDTSTVTSTTDDITVTPGSGNFALTFNPANVTITDLSGTLSIAKGGTGQTSQTNAFDALAPTTTTGDIIYFNGTDNTRLQVGVAGTVLVGGTNPSYTANPTATTWGSGDANNGQVSLGSNNIGWKINSTNELGLTATSLYPVTNQGLSLGSAANSYLSAYSSDARGWREATLSTTAGANDFATVPVATSGVTNFLIKYTVFGPGTSSNFSAKGYTYMITAVNKAGTLSIQVNSSIVGTSASSAAGTWGINTAALTATDAGSGNMTLTVTTVFTAGAPTSLTMRYKIEFLYDDPVVTEIL